MLIFDNEGENGIILYSLLKFKGKKDGTTYVLISVTKTDKWHRSSESSDHDALCVYGHICHI